MMPGTARVGGRIEIALAVGVLFVMTAPSLAAGLHARRYLMLAEEAAIGAGE